MGVKCGCMPPTAPSRPSQLAQILGLHIRRREPLATKFCPTFPSLFSFPCDPRELFLTYHQLYCWVEFELEEREETYCFGLQFFQSSGQKFLLTNSTWQLLLQFDGFLHGVRCPAAESEPLLALPRGFLLQHRVPESGLEVAQENLLEPRGSSASHIWSR
jgi:hypothetical protein